MIKKIDANKYGVVRYAISSIEDIADLPREVSVGSEAILVNEDGEKKFRLGSDGWVEVVEVKEYDEDKLRDILEDAKVGYGGIEYETLEERLDKDFDNAYSVLDNRTYIEYEGCRITAKDSLNGLQKETIIKGRTLQNCIKDVASLYHSKGLCNNNKWITLEQKTDVDTPFSYLAENILLKPNTVYTMFLDINKNTILDKNSGYTYHFTVSKNGLGYGNFTCNLNSVFGVGAGEIGLFREKFAYREVDGYNGIKLGTGGFVSRSGTDNNGKIVFRIFILEGDYTQTPLEELPFIEGIGSVGDKSKNLFNPNNLKQTVLDLGKANQECVEKESLQRCSIRNIPCKPNTKYTFKSDKDFYIALGSIDSNNLALGDTGWIMGKVGYTYTTPSNAVELAMNFQNETNTRITPDDVRAINLQLEEGARATAYEPYYDGYKISGKSHGKNLIDLSKMIPHAKIDHKIEGNKVILVGNEPYPYVLTKIPIDVRMISGKRLRMSADSITSTSEINQKVRLLQLNVTYLDGSMEYHGVMTGKKDQIFTLGKNIAYAYVCFYTNNTENYEMGKTVIINPMLEIQENGSVSISYEPYKESTYSYILDEPLRSLPNGVCDEIDLEKGIVTRRVGKFVLDGSEPWEIQSTDTNGNGLVNFRLDCYKLGNFITRKVSHNGTDTICDSFCYGGMIANEKNETYHFGEQTLYIRKFISSNITTVSDFKQWLQDNPTTVYYELANPTTEYLIKNDKFVTLPNGVEDKISYNSVLRKVGKIVLNGSESWGQLLTIPGGTDTVGFQCYLPNSKPSSNVEIEIMCDTLTVYKANDLWYYGGTDNICSLNVDNRYQIRVNKNELSENTIEEFRKWLSRNPVTVYYQLKTPYMEPINLNEVILDTTRLKSYEPITHITSDNYLLPTIKTQVPSDFNAVVLGLKSNNEALASQVMSLRQTNDELETTNREQDDVIDVTLLALDEVYGMIDEGEIETMSMGSPMVNVYVKMIKRGIKTLDEVPTKYRAEVEELI